MTTANIITTATANRIEVATADLCIASYTAPADIEYLVDDQVAALTDGTLYLIAEDIA